MTGHKLKNILLRAMGEAAVAAKEAALKHNTSLLVWDDETNKMKEISPAKLKKEFLNNH